MMIIELCSTDPYFDSEFGFYIQEDGTPMGGPLSCLIADVFMEEYEKQIKYEIDGIYIDMDWVRFRDDTFMEWMYSEEELYKFWQYLNSIHPNIQWDEPVIEKDGEAYFLDVKVIRNQNSEEEPLLTSVYRKPSHTDRYLHFSSNHPLQSKLATLNSLKIRAHNYCSTPELLKS